MSTGHNYEPDETDTLIESTSNLAVWACSSLNFITISDTESAGFKGFIHLHEGEAIAAARAILKYFGEEA